MLAGPVAQRRVLIHGPAGVEQGRDPLSGIRTRCTRHARNARHPRQAPPPPPLRPGRRHRPRTVSLPAAPRHDTHRDSGLAPLPAKALGPAGIPSAFGVTLAGG